MPRFVGGVVAVVAVFPLPSLLSDPYECVANAVGKVTLGLCVLLSSLFLRGFAAVAHSTSVFSELALRGRSATVSLASLALFGVGGWVMANVAYACVWFNCSRCVSAGCAVVVAFGRMCA